MTDNTIADMNTKDWLTKQQFADELGITVQTFNVQILNKDYRTKKGIPDPGPLYAQKRGKANIYSPAYLELVKKGRGETVARKRSTEAKTVNPAKFKATTLKIELANFKDDELGFLQQRFDNPKNLQLFLEKKLEEVLAPVKQLKADYEKGLKSLLAKKG